MMVGGGDYLLTYYGDDFTGSTDVMEALTSAGLPAQLYVSEAPRSDSFLPIELRAIGYAGSSRGMTTAQMDAELPTVFAALAGFRCPLVHYKVCSTFDSSPRIGNIGRAAEIGQRVLGCSWVPVVVGAPSLGRYCSFGNLFARSGLDSPVYRLDRHPTMQRHPTTPMSESDLRLVLGEQTDKKIGLVDWLQLERDPDQALDVLLADGCELVLFDTLTEKHLAAVGRILDERSQRERLFVVGSSGVEYALVAHWRQQGRLSAPPSLRSKPVEQILVVSGSCSPVTARQIRWAVEHGFEEIPLEPQFLARPTHGARERERAQTLAISALQSGRSVILHTALGPEDPRIEATRQQFLAHGGDAADSAEVLGGHLGSMARLILEQTEVRRLATTGGDSSGYVARDLLVDALEMAAPCAPGSPLCRVASFGWERLNGTEIVFKGGQVGTDDFFGRVLRGYPGEG